VITGTVRLDLTDVPADRQRHRVGALHMAPDGARVVLIIGPLMVAPNVVRHVRPHIDRLHVDVQGEAIAVRQWIDALKTGETLPGLAVS
jgi:hypothetical protein